MNFFDRLAYNFGYLPEEDLLYRSLPADKRQSIDSKLKNLNNLEYAADLNKAWKEIAALKKEYNEQLKNINSFSTKNPVSGFQPAGSVLRKLYPNPFALHTFIGENYAPAVRARRYTRVEFERDGYVLMSKSGTGRNKIKKVMTTLDELGILKLRSELFDHLKIFSNFFIVRERNGLGGTTGIRLLIPSRIEPIYKFDELIGWQYKWNNKIERFHVSEVDHVKTYSLLQQDFGSPILTSMVVDIEAAMHSGIYSNTLWQKGGLIRAVIALDPLVSQMGGINESANISFAQKLQEFFARQFAGVRGSGTLMFSPAVRGVHPVISPKDLEGPFKETRERTAIEACELLGCPPEIMGLTMTSQYQNKAAIMDFASLAIDNDNYYLASLVDNYITDTYIRGVMQEKDIVLKQSGEFGAVSPMAADFLFKVAAAACDFMTVNEARVKVMHWEPREGPEGEQFIGHYKNTALLMKASKESDSDKRKAMLEEVLGPKDNPSKITGKKVKLERHYPDEIMFY